MASGRPEQVAASQLQIQSQTIYKCPTETPGEDEGRSSLFGIFLMQTKPDEEMTDVVPDSPFSLDPS